MDKTKVIKRAAALVIAVVVVVSCFAGCGDNKVYREYNEIKDSGKIKIGVSADNIPLGYADENGEYQGFEIVFANRLAKEMGVKVEFVPTETEDRAKYLETGKVDIIIDDFAVEKAAKKLVDFAKPYMKSALATVSSDKTKDASLDSLGEKDSVIVVSGSSAATYMSKNYPDANIVECVDDDEAINSLIDNKGVLWIGENTRIAEFAIQTEGYSMDDKELGDEVKYAPAVSKGNKTLIKKINKIIDKLDKEDFFISDYNETLASVYGEDYMSAFVVESEDKTEEDTSASDSSESTQASTGETATEASTAGTTSSKTSSTTSSKSKSSSSSKTKVSGSVPDDIAKSE